MGIASYRLKKQIAGCFVLFLAVPMAEVAGAMPLPMLSPQQS
jgi:hypothetical protein